MQVVADHQDRAAGLAPHLLDQPVELGHARLVEPLRRLVENQQVGPRQQRARQQHPLELPARQPRHLPRLEPRHADARQHLRPSPPAPPHRQRQEARHRHRQRRVDGSRCGT
jgi:hypothetical protein